MNLLLVSCIFIAYVSRLNAKNLDIVGIDEAWVCGIKSSCLNCLRLPQCSWCSIDSKCFSKQLLNHTSTPYCQNDTIYHTDYGMSLEKNAECACIGSALMKNCRPPGNDEALECSDRGTCVCGRCFCNPQPDPENPSKVIMGEYCQYDNFSCDGPKCNEGPYSMYDMALNERNILAAIAEEPVEQ